MRLQFQNRYNTDRFRNWKRLQLLYQNWKCAYCRCDLHGIKYEIDHVRPLYSARKKTSRLNNYSNLVISCRECNRKKGISTNYSYPEWIKKNRDKIRNEYTLQERYELYFKKNRRQR